jgi:hypothetical protein
MVTEAQEACSQGRARVDSLYNAAHHFPWRSTCLMADSICPFASLAYSTNMLLSIQHPVIYT